jgi:spore germination protein YaaH
MSTYDYMAAHSLSSQEIESMRSSIISLLNNINTNKQRIRTSDFNQLNNNLRYALNTLSNMHNFLSIAPAPASPDAGNAWCQSKRVVYNPDGSTRIVDSQQFHTTGEDWERQFDERLQIRAPCYQHPPNTITSIPRIRQASNHGYDMTRAL